MFEIHQQSLSESLKSQINQGFGQHAIAMVGFDERNEPVCFVAHEKDHFAGAIVVQLFWGALHIKYLFLEEAQRGKGLGTELMIHAESFAKQHKCPFIFVETMSFQAGAFYEKMGFKVDFTRSGYAHNTSLVYLKKDLVY